MTASPGYVLSMLIDRLRLPRGEIVCLATKHQRTVRPYTSSLCGLVQKRHLRCDFIVLAATTTFTRNRLTMRTLCVIAIVALAAVAAADLSVPRARSPQGGVLAYGHHERESSVAKSHAFKYLLFSQQATEGYCRTQKRCVQSKIRDYWTIHGLWPTNDTNWPQNCDPAHKFDPDLIADIRTDLDRYWPSVTAKNSNSFWAHEWSKHGTCAKEIEQLSDEHKYFSYTLQLYQKWNLTKYLEEAGIVPDDEKTYDAEDIKNALDEDLRGLVNIVCQETDDLDYPVLTEVRFCISKQFEVIDCPNKEQGCQKGPVYYVKTSS